MGVFSKKSPEANWPIQPSTRSTATPRWRNEVLGEPMTLEEDALACQARCSGRLGTVEAAIRTLVWEYHEMLVRAMVELGARTFGGLGEPWVPRLLIGMKWLRAATDSGFNYFSKALLLFWGPSFLALSKLEKVKTEQTSGWGEEPLLQTVFRHHAYPLALYNQAMTGAFLQVGSFP